MTRSAVIIFLHGLGDSGAGWSSLPSVFRGRGNITNWRFSFPTAPKRSVTCNDGAVGTAWMDLQSIPVTPRDPDDAAGFSASSSIVHSLIDAEIERGTEARDIFLGGFSQGAAMALWSGLSYPRGPLGGILALSGWWPGSLTPPIASRAGERVLICHGDDDRVVLGECASAAREALLARGGVAVETHSFEGGHGFDPEESQWMFDFISKRLNE